MGRQQRPKLDRYPTHLFLTTYHVAVDLDAARLDETEVNAFFNNRWLITVRKDDGVPMDRVIARWDRSPALMQHGVGFLLYGLLDVIVDDYFAVLSELDDFYERVSDVIFAEKPLEPSRQRHWFEMRQVMVALPPSGGADAGDGEHLDASRTGHRPRGPLPLLPGRL